jgi:hypothetical protein
MTGPPARRLSQRCGAESDRDGARLRMSHLPDNDARSTRETRPEPKTIAAKFKWRLADDARNLRKRIAFNKGGALCGKSDINTHNPFCRINGDASCRASVRNSFKRCGPPSTT